jgi:hypothetical protein
LKEYGQLGKLIKQETIERPVEPDRSSYNFSDPDRLDRALYLEELKLYHRKIEDYDKNAPKLYGLILQYLSNESLEAVKKDEGWETIEADADLEGLWKVVVQKHKVHSASEVGQIVKLSARQLYRSMRQGSFESIISYKERFNSALAAYKDQENSNMQDEDIALDFFSGLDNARYADIKADFLNGLTSGAIEAPECFNCEGDHYIKDCPELKRNKSNNNSNYGGMAAITFEATTFMTYASERRELHGVQGHRGFVGQPGKY